MPLSNFGLVAPANEKRGSLYRAAQPDRLGLKTMWYLKIEMSYRLSHSDESDVSMEQERNWFIGEVLHDEYREILRFDEERKVHATAAAIEYLLLRKRNVLVHCNHGRDRTGLICAAWQLLYDGQTLAEVEQQRDLYGVHGLIAWMNFPDKKILEHIAGRVK